MRVKLFSRKNGSEQPEPKSKKKRRWKKIRRFVVIGVILAVSGGLLLRYFVLDQSAAAVGTTYQYVAVERRDIYQTLSGTGTLQPIETYTVDTLVSGEILEAPFEEGDSVEEGDVLYKINTSEIERSIERQKLSVEKAQMNLGDLLESNENLSIRSTASGLVSVLYIEEGDQVQSGTKIADILDNSSMLLTVPFNSSDADNIKAGQKAVVTLDNSFETLSGTVTSINQVEQVLDGYMIVKYVTIMVANPGGLSTSTNATATVGDIACNSGAAFEYLSQKTVTAKASGEVTDLFVSKGSSVGSGDFIALLEGSDTSTQIKSAEMTLTDAELTLEDLYDELDSYKITSPISGTVITKSYNAGETVGGMNASSSTMAVIYDLSKLTFDLSIDELDIGLIEVGQEVSITADALESTEFTGYVSNISISGTTQNGVTTYPATVIIDEPGELLPGMNISAEIVVDSAENVLAIPVSAVSRGNTVLVNSDSESASNASTGMAMPGMMQQDSDASNNDDTQSADAGTAGTDSSVSSNATSGTMPARPSVDAEIMEKMQSMNNTPDGYTRVTVTLGLNDDDYIEVTSGLQEGDTIAIAIVETTNSDTSETATGFGFGGMTGSAQMPTGGMPQGGFSGSGMPGGNR